MANGTKERERSADKPEGDLEEKIEGLEKEIEEIKNSIRGISRIEELLKNVRISTKYEENEIFIDAEYDQKEGGEQAIRDATEVRENKQLETRDEPLAPSSTKGTSTSDDTNDKRSRIDNWRSQLQARGERRSESRPGYSRTHLRGRNRHDSPQFDESSSSRPKSKPDQDDGRIRSRSKGRSPEKLTEKEPKNLKSAEKREEPLVLSPTRGLRELRVAENRDGLLALTSTKETIPSDTTSDKRSRNDGRRNQPQFRRYERSESRPGYFRTTSE